MEQVLECACWSAAVGVATRSMPRMVAIAMAVRFLAADLLTANGSKTPSRSRGRRVETVVVQA